MAHGGVIRPLRDLGAADTSRAGVAPTGTAPTDTSRAGVAPTGTAPTDTSRAGVAPTGEPAELSALFRQHHLALVRLAVQLVDDIETAEDLVQGVFAALHRRLDGALPDAADPKRYLQAAVVNRSRSVLRRRKVARAFLTREPRSPGPDSEAESADGASIRRADRERVLAVITRLPRRQREVVVLRYYEDLTVTEISELLRTSPSAVTSSLSSGLTRLRCAIGGSDDH